MFVTQPGRGGIQMIKALFEKAGQRKSICRRYFHPTGSNRQVTQATMQAVECSRDGINFRD
jgi:hypothetical protein